MEKCNELYKGKTKSIYSTIIPSLCIMHYRNDISAFDGAKVEQLEDKGMVNNFINAFIMEKLADAHQIAFYSTNQ